MNLNTEILIEASRLMRTQDNRSTQYPLWIVQEEMGIEVSREQSWDVKERRDSDYLSDGDICEACLKLQEKNGNLPDDCENDDCSDACFRYIVEEYVMASRSGGPYLTEKECEDHIKDCSYRYNKPRSYVISAYGNEEMIAVMRHILSLTDGPIPTCYL